jgi:hypothetical protein
VQYGRLDSINGVIGIANWVVLVVGILGALAAAAKKQNAEERLAQIRSKD